MKVVVNRCYGGFGLSDKAIEMIMKRKGLNCFRYKMTKLNKYTRCDKLSADDYLFGCYATKDLGEKISKIPSEFYWYEGNLNRNDVDLVAIVEELGEEANGRFAQLEIVKIPHDVLWEIDDYGGIETIHIVNICCKEDFYD